MDVVSQSGMWVDSPGITPTLYTCYPVIPIPAMGSYYYGVGSPMGCLHMTGIIPPPYYRYAWVG